ncbi:1-(5-phosphoribosyl)-5-((5-phosphoribosylamino)methylideneamino)imidazole-4-carboxamide isomerase [Enterobacteriaceae endosymbiont of Donacia bicoloricornis]|uniref:1-(5-phosphoribosyl)-5-[(5- phosphoribosylamino)methylideneamino] imidazole-4-carboxamide isomerase n=1 Tax=Enterobacteriaceae endosymbiont of Donacia bicoloricornis TaxID=2675772 RepID=UPI00144906C7|nr:1-(5-phosphoribosyl)-5-[(5-phosphoribosylamino)methylideneamino] imidazole-4-carboxamide isomerase [Enterobacteriaceae endosymbiont of Donacia bicoloricornis]QJC37657.1 1-(5-phosphoribosyl)-5-((5-phosphoribosylamino)methylideneamino)imidazole-4-carboxamide isomerase [Enterobacteriaceae endosymbiont of Donacia bicoloricornis]
MIIPAIDLIKGKVVRLHQGKFNLKRQYLYKPLFYIKKYIKQGAKKIHIIDLDGAKDPNKKQIVLLKNIFQYNSFPIQLGGGIRCKEDIDLIFNLIPKVQIILGSSIIHNLKNVQKLFQIYNPNSLILALDVKINKKNEKIIFINGWQDKSNIIFENIIEKFLDLGLKHVLCTDISRDGTFLGPNINLYTEIVQKYPQIFFQASGGVSSLKDIINLKKSGVKHIIIGRAFLEKKFTIKEANLCWQKE